MRRDQGERYRSSLLCQRGDLEPELQYLGHVHSHQVCPVARQAPLALDPSDSGGWEEEKEESRRAGSDSLRGCNPRDGTQPSSASSGIIGEGTNTPPSSPIWALPSSPPAHPHAQRSTAHTDCRQLVSAESLGMILHKLQ